MCLGYRAGKELEEALKRHLCCYLMFWTACGHKKCLQERACAGYVKDCFNRLWPLVLEEVKISIHAIIKAQHAGLSSAEVVVEAERELARDDGAGSCG
jgi:hypothetical protein